MSGGKIFIVRNGNAVQPERSQKLICGIFICRMLHPVHALSAISYQKVFFPMQVKDARRCAQVRITSGCESEGAKKSGNQYCNTAVGVWTPVCTPAQMALFLSSGFAALSSRCLLTDRMGKRQCRACLRRSADMCCARRYHRCCARFPAQVWRAGTEHHPCVLSPACLRVDHAGQHRLCSKPCLHIGEN